MDTWSNDNDGLEMYYVNYTHKLWSEKIKVDVVTCTGMMSELSIWGLIKVPSEFNESNKRTN